MIIECNRHWQYTDTESGLIMPWYTLPCLHWLKTMDISRWSIFEYGSGYSTIWFRLNCDKLISVDSDERWAKAMSSYYVPQTMPYIESPLASKRIYDCLVIDGVHREACVQVSKETIKSNGYLIIDNWGQEDFPPDACERTLELLKDWPYQIFAQPNHSTWKTAVFVKP